MGHAVILMERNDKWLDDVRASCLKVARSSLLLTCHWSKLTSLGSRNQLLPREVPEVTQQQMKESPFLSPVARTDCAAPMATAAEGGRHREACGIW